jgi:hypothetical protein
LAASAGVHLIDREACALQQSVDFCSDIQEVALPRRLHLCFRVLDERLKFGM